METERIERTSTERQDGLSQGAASESASVFPQMFLLTSLDLIYYY